MDMGAKGAYQLLQHYVCHDYKKSHGGNGMGGIHNRHYAHRLYLIPKIEETEHGKKSFDGDGPAKCDKVTIKMVSPAPGHRRES